MGAHALLLLSPRQHLARATRLPACLASCRRALSPRLSGRATSQKWPWLVLGRQLAQQRWLCNGARLDPGWWCTHCSLTNSSMQLLQQVRLNLTLPCSGFCAQEKMRTEGTGETRTPEVGFPARWAGGGRRWSRRALSAALALRLEQ